MKEFIKCRDLIVNKKNIQCVSIGCVINGKCYICIELNDSVTKPMYIMCNNETEAREEFNNIYKQLQEEEMGWTDYTEGVVEESQPQKYKITLREFWENDKKLAIHCDTEEKAQILLKAFDKLGKKWCDGDSYLADDCYRRDVCYDNNCEHGHYCYYKGAKYKIYEFDEVDLDN